MKLETLSFKTSIGSIRGKCRDKIQNRQNFFKSQKKSNFKVTPVGKSAPTWIFKGKKSKVAGEGLKNVQKFFGGVKVNIE